MARATGGYVKLHRKILANEFLIGDPRLCWGLMLLICWARWRDDEHVLKRQRRALKRGECITGARDLGVQLGYEDGKAAEHGGERVLKRLEELKIIGREAGNCGSIITVLNYDEYQGEDGDTTGADTGAVPGADTGTAPGHKKNSRTEELKKLRAGPASARDRATVIIAKAIASLVSDLEADPKPTLGQSRDRAAAAVGSDWPAFSLAHQWPIFSREYLKATRRKAEHLYEGDAVDKLAAILASQTSTQIEDHEGSH